MLKRLSFLLLNLFWYSSTLFDNSSLVNFFNELSDIAITNLKLHFKKSSLQLKNLKANQNTSTCNTYKISVRKSKYAFVWHIKSQIYFFVFVYRQLSVFQINLSECTHTIKTYIIKWLKHVIKFITWAKLFGATVFRYLSLCLYLITW